MLTCVPLRGGNHGTGGFHKMYVPSSCSVAFWSRCVQSEGASPSSLRAVVYSWLVGDSHSFGLGSKSRSSADRSRVRAARRRASGAGSMLLSGFGTEKALTLPSCFPALAAEIEVKSNIVSTVDCIQGTGFLSAGTAQDGIASCRTTLRQRMPCRSRA